MQFAVYAIRFPDGRYLGKYVQLRDVVSPADPPPSHETYYRSGQNSQSNWYALYATDRPKLYDSREAAQEESRMLIGSIIVELIVKTPEMA